MRYRKIWNLQTKWYLGSIQVSHALSNMIFHPCNKLFSILEPWYGDRKKTRIDISYDDFKSSMKSWGIHFTLHRLNLSDIKADIHGDVWWILTLNNTWKLGQLISPSFHVESLHSSQALYNVHVLINTGLSLYSMLDWHILQL